MIHIYRPGKPQRMKPLVSGLDVFSVTEQIDSCEDLWNEIGFRNLMPGSPHRDADDIWFRARHIEDFNPDAPLTEFLSEHVPVWYPSVKRCPDVIAWANFFRHEYFNGGEVGTVLATRIPAGKEVFWHIDGGWNQKYYDTKVALMLKSNKDQAYMFEREAMVAEPGEAFCFWNEYPHRVVNASDDDRLSLIFSIRTRAEQCRSELRVD
jgi:hypothetical protein